MQCFTVEEQLKIIQTYYENRRFKNNLNSLF